MQTANILKLDINSSTLLILLVVVLEACASQSPHQRSSVPFERSVPNERPRESRGLGGQFEVVGNTQPELWQSLHNNGPKKNDEIYLGLTAVEFDWEPVFNHSTDGRCFVSAVNVDLRMRSWGPYWAGSQGASAATHLWWENLETLIWGHEMQHQFAAKHEAQMIREYLLRIGPKPNCDQVRAVAESIVRGISLSKAGFEFLLEYYSDIHLDRAVPEPDISFTVPEGYCESREDRIIECR
jgi:predicted secreted Zn-dependent protease